MTLMRNRGARGILFDESAACAQASFGFAQGMDLARVGVSINHESDVEVILLAAVYLLLVLVLPLALSAAIGWRSLPGGRRCPHCEAETLLLRSRLSRWSAALLKLDLRRRWCPACGWMGLVRPSRAPLRLPQRSAKTTRTIAPVTRVIDVRSLRVDGAHWSVRLECWGNRGRCFGRLVFVEASGRLWLDSKPLLGRSDGEVLDQALALPDALLTSRLRSLVSD